MNNNVSWINDTIKNRKFIQNNDQRKPVLAFDKKLRSYYLQFDGLNDYVYFEDFPAEDDGDFNETYTIFILVKFKNLIDNESLFDNGNNINVQFNPIQNNVVITIGFFHRSYIRNVRNIIGKTDLWTIRLVYNDPNHKLEFFRGTNMTPIFSENINNYTRFSTNDFLIGGAASESFSKIDLYYFHYYKRSLSDLELRQMFNYFESKLPSS